MTRPPRIGELFAGYGGLAQGLQEVIGGDVVWFSEFDSAPSKILAHHWPDVPNHGDITKIDWSTVEPVDILTGGFPCQDVSLAGARRGLKEGTRSGLWSYFAEAIGALKPEMVVIENVRGILSADASSGMEPCPECVGDGPDAVSLRALGAVLGDLADIGYDAEWGGVRAADAGAPHGRFRVFIVAYPNGGRDGRGATVSGGGEGQGANVEADGANHRLGSTGSIADTPENADLPASNQRGQSTPGQTESGWSRADISRRSRTPTTDGAPTSDANDPGRGEHGRGESVRPEHVTSQHPRDDTATDASGERLRQHPREPSAEEAGPGSSHVADGSGGSRAATDWGPYLPAIRRWEAVTGRPAPAPTNGDGKKGSHRLSARFVEWMMGLDAGHVTNPAIGLTRNEQLKALGNGVVPQQAALAIRHLLSRTA